ncbi:B12-binding domain-containing radical SAM protein [Micromonospora craniellae]|uniref:Radical SAM protein n=1 Tax=Micromonospora craniellae TaxID=2294034 RepID=A0A372FRP0_9ACTN|nr:radical SAM protein [Micromonospora craniellae]QOC93916.1 radical SAM protein [Micromonospora craniellae]RFS43403.1 radical SAM protein [Micromonospora craniellae]
MWDIAPIHATRAKDCQGEVRIAFAHLSFRKVARTRAVRSKALFSAHFPALGLLNLAQQLRDRFPNRHLRGWVRYFDEEAYETRDEMESAIREWLRPASLGLLGMSTYTSSIDHVADYCRRFIADDVLIVLGGAHVTVVPDDLPCHVIVRGEGCEALVTIIESLGTPDFVTRARTAGICCQLGQTRIDGRAATDNSIETTSVPGFAYDLLSDLGPGTYATSYTRLLGVNPQIYVCTQSCRARCSFCSTYLIHRRMQARSVELIAQDLTLLRNHGYDSIEFHDDDLLQHPDFDALLAVLRQLQLPWFCYARSEILDENVAEKMAEAGCRRVFLGLEAMTQSSLDYLNKATTVEQNRTAAAALDRQGIGAVSGFIIGLPHHTVTDVLAELDAFLALPLFAISCNVLTPDPRTREFMRARRRSDELQAALGGSSGLTVIPDIQRWGLDQPVGLPSVCTAIDKQTLNDLVSVIEYAFYLRPHVTDALYSSARTQTQRDVITAYLAFVRARLAEREPHVTDDLVRARIAELKVSG